MTGAQSGDFERPKPKPTPRKRAPRTPRTNPELAVRRAELPPVPQPVQEPVTAVVEMPLLPARSDDPPIYRHLWNERFGLPAAPG